MTTYDQIRLITLDLDGTLLHDDKHISEYTLQTLKALTDRGLIVVPASGRNLSGMEDNVLKVPDIHYAICSNGAIVYHLPSGKAIYEAPIALENALTVIKYLRQLPVHYYVHTSQGTLRSAVPNPADFQEKFPFIRFQETTVPDLETYLKETYAKTALTIFKMGIFVTDDRLFADLLKKGSPFPNLSFLQTGDGIIELNSIHASKGAGLAALCRHLAIPMTQTLAIGDSQNDLAMLRQAGVSAAMGNALEAVQSAADYQVGTNEEDGAARFLEEFFRIGYNSYPTARSEPDSPENALSLRERRSGH